MGETRQAAGPSLSTHVLQGALSQAQRLYRGVLICTQASSGCTDSGEATPHVTAAIVPGRCGRKGDASQRYHRQLLDRKPEVSNPIHHLLMMEIKILSLCLLQNPCQ